MKPREQLTEQAHESRGDDVEWIDVSQEQTVLGVKIRYADTGKKISVVETNGEKEVVVNKNRWSSSEEALRRGVLEAGFIAELQSTLQRDTKEFLKVKGRKGLLPALKIAGVQKLKMQSPDLAEIISVIDCENDTVQTAFEYACSQYVLTGSVPDTVAPEIQAAIKNIKSKGGKNALDFIASGQYTLEVMADLYTECVAPELEKLKQQAKEQSQTSGDAYRPHTETGDEVPLEEGQIEQKVEPFYGGYYRGRIYYYDPDQLQIVEDKTLKETFAPDIQEEDLEGFKRYTFSGVYDPTKENVLNLPYKALPLAHSLKIQVVDTPTTSVMGSIRKRIFGSKQKPPALQIMRDTQGVFSLEPKGETPIATRIPFQFEFVLKATADNALNHPPEEKHLKILGTPMDEETEAFIATLSHKSHLLPEERVRRVEAFVRKKFSYPKNTSERNEMNQRYLAAGRSVLSVMCDHGVADCHWADIFSGELIKRLGIAVAHPGEFYIQKDPRFEFAALAGIGHVWGEFWNGKEWLRFDATPPKESDEESEKNEEPKENAEGDYGDQSDVKEEEELTIEEIEELFKDLLNAENEEKKPSEPPKMFEGVPFAKWHEVERFIKEVNATPISKSMSITKRESTLYQEWRALFDLIYKKRELPESTFKGPLRRSEGDILDDPVDAYIDKKAGEDDEFGYKKEAHKTREVVEITEFEDDVVADLTASMKSSGAYLEQKKMVLTSSFNTMGLNRRLNLSYNRNKMRSSLTVKTHIASFKGETTTQLHHTREDEMNEKKLCELYDAFDNTETGSGNLYGALNHYKATITPELQRKLKSGKLKKVLTIISDGEIGNQAEVVELVQDLRALGVIVQGIGFGAGAQSIRVICHDPSDTEAAIVLDDVRGATLARHKLLAKHLKKL